MKKRLVGYVVKDNDTEKRTLMAGAEHDMQSPSGCWTSTAG